METNAKNIFETMMDTQKQFVENLNNDYFKKWYDNQMSFFNQNNAKSENNSTQANASNPLDFFNNFYQQQMKASQDMFNMMNGAMTNMMNMKPQNNDTMQGMFQNWTSMLNKTYANMLSNFGQTGTQKEAFMGLFNTSEMYMKLFEFMMPMFKAMQDKSFNMDAFKNFFNAEQYKEMMDKMFQFNPEMFNQMKDFYLNAIKQNVNMSSEAYEQMKKSFENMPSMGSESFEKALEQYQSFTTKVNDYMSPMVKMMSPGKDRDQMIAMNELGDQMVKYQVRDAQFKYMLYTTGIKAMESLAKNVAKKIEAGENYSDFNQFFNEWINTNDQVFGELFSSPEYSKFQSEFTETVMLVKKGVEKQMEKMMENIPVITRSEMDDLYKSVYEMQKHIRSLEKKIESLESNTKEEKPAKITKK